MAIITPKLSVGRVVGDFAKPKEKTPLCRFNGIARSYERGESMIGNEMKPWIRFKGVFSALNLLTGESYGPSPVLFLPDHVANMLAYAIDNDLPPTIGVRINLEIIAMPSDTPIGYRFDVASLPGDKLVESTMKMLAEPGAADAAALPAADDLQ